MERLELEREVGHVSERIDDDDGTLLEIWFDGEGCALSQAIVSMLSEKLEGLRTDDVRELSFQEAMARIDCDADSLRTACCRVGFDVIQQTVNSERIDSVDSPTFGGPDLGDEC